MLCGSARHQSETLDSDATAEMKVGKSDSSSSLSYSLCKVFLKNKFCLLSSDPAAYQCDYKLGFFPLAYD
jgi:hypothetical protein